MSDGLSPVQVASIRWVVLETICAAFPVAPATERMCQDAVTAAYPAAGEGRLRAELEYLESAGLIELKKPGVLPWSAKLTNHGRDVVEYVAEAPAGIIRPPNGHFRRY